MNRPSLSEQLDDYAITQEVARETRGCRDDLKEALSALRDFREFAMSNAKVWRLGANHHNPMWARVAGVLEKHGMNQSVPENTFRAED
jgi:hypothetical protein